MRSIKISVITVTFNCVDQIEDTIKSIVNNKYNNKEYIIIDGGSSDGTIDIIKKYTSNIDLWISEPDKGIYDAMNKGIEKALGEWILFINAGDQLMSIPDNELTLAFQDGYDALCGAIIVNDTLVVKPSYTNSIKLHNTLPHQGLFYNKKNMLSLFNISYRVFADYDYNLKMYLNKRKVMTIDKIIASHSLDGISNNKEFIKEFYSIIGSNTNIFFQILSFLRFKMKGLKKRMIISK